MSRSVGRSSWWSSLVPYADKPAVFWLHNVKAKASARILAYGGARPIAFASDVGKGKVAVFAGTVLGQGDGESRPFWECPSWKSLLKKMIAE